tara:strand:- start:987 stop:1292 length:306 start_codon:yes stop_codon:yes gene_type:complete
MNQSHKSDFHCLICNLLGYQQKPLLKEFEAVPLVTMALESDGRKPLFLRVHEGPCFQELKGRLGHIFGTKSGDGQWRGVEVSNSMGFADVCGDMPTPIEEG